MANLRTSPSPNGKYLSSPDQASRIFNSSGLAPIRQKHLFLVRFLRRAFGQNDQWKDGLSFVVKAIDRPSVKPVLEELNQYNRKRQIQTGVKYEPINLTIYDTIDSSGGSGAAMKMWLEYASYHFGDYNHFENINDFADDIYNVEMNDSNQAGYGFKLPPKLTLAGDIGSQFYFDGLEVIQVHGNKFVKYTLVNPRISSFTPDDLDYSNSEAATIQMQISYEAIIHQANGQAQTLDAATIEIYKDLLIGTGQAGADSPFNLPNPMPNTAPSQTNDGVAPNPLLDGAAQYMEALGVKKPNILTDSIASLTGGGVLERFGSFDFGNTSSLLNGLPSEVSLAGDLSGAVGARNASALDSSITRGIFGAAQQMGVSPLDVATNYNGLQLNAATLAIANKSKDGTSQIGFRRDA